MPVTRRAIVVLGLVLGVVWLYFSTLRSESDRPIESPRRDELVVPGDPASFDAPAQEPAESAQLEDESSASNEPSSVEEVAAADARESIEDLWWPNPPEVTESMITQGLVRDIRGIVTMGTIDCRNTACELEITVSKREPFLAQLLPDGLPAEWLDAGVAQQAAERVAETEVSETFVVHLSSYTNYTLFGSTLSEEDIVALDGQPVDRPEQARLFPAIVGTMNGVDVIERYICTYDCREDGRRVISLGVPSGKTCQQVGGVERSILADTYMGLRELTICSPSILN